MADTSIGNLTAATSVTGVDIIPVVQGGVTKRATVSQLPSLGGGGSGSGSGAAYTVDAANPPTGSGLTAVAADGSTNDAEALNAALSYVKTTYGGGRLVLPPNRTIKLNSTITVPSGVQLQTPDSTILDFSSLGASIAVAVNDHDCTPLIGGTIKGPNQSGTGSSFPATASTGLSVTGTGLFFRGVKIQFFNYGIDQSNSNTYLNVFEGGVISNCNILILADATGTTKGTSALSEFGERLIFRDCVFANAKNLGVFAGGGTDVFFTGCSMDFLLQWGLISDAHVFFTDCHFETRSTTSGSNEWATQNTWLVHAQYAARVYFTDCEFILGGGSGANITHIIDPSTGPANYRDGRVIFSPTCTAYGYNSAEASYRQHFADEMNFTTTATTLQVGSPFLTKWGPVTAALGMNDTTPGAANTVTVTTINQTTGVLTLTFGSAPTSGIAVRIHY